MQLDRMNEKGFVVVGAAAGAVVGKAVAVEKAQERKRRNERREFVSWGSMGAVVFFWRVSVRNNGLCMGDFVCGDWRSGYNIVTIDI